MRQHNQGLIAVGLGLFTATVATVPLYLAVTLVFVIPLALGLVSIALGLWAFFKEPPAARWVGWLALALLLVGTAVPYALLAVADRSGPPVHIVVPDGFRGPVKFLIRPKQGMAVPLADGRYTYIIPAKGVLLIQDDTPFRRWHSETAAFADGTPIPVDHSDLRPDAVALRDLGSGEKDIKYFVGTEAEVDAYVQAGEP